MIYRCKNFSQFFVFFAKIHYRDHYLNIQRREKEFDPDGVYRPQSGHVRKIIFVSFFYIFIGKFEIFVHFLGIN